MNVSMEYNGSPSNNKPIKCVSAYIIFLHDMVRRRPLWEGTDNRGVNGKASRKDGCSDLCDDQNDLDIPLIVYSGSNFSPAMDLYLVWHDIPSAYCDNRQSQISSCPDF